MFGGRVVARKTRRQSVTLLVVGTAPLGQGSIGDRDDAVRGARARLRQSTQAINRHEHAPRSTTSATPAAASAPRRCCSCAHLRQQRLSKATRTSSARTGRRSPAARRKVNGSARILYRLDSLGGGPRFARLGSGLASLGWGAASLLSAEGAASLGGARFARLGAMTSARDSTEMPKCIAILNTS